MKKHRAGDVSRRVSNRRAGGDGGGVKERIKGLTGGGSSRKYRVEKRFGGIRKLVERAVPAGTSEAQMDAVYEAFNPYYARHCADLTVPYDGILPLLQKLQAQGVVCALVSNKPDYAVQTLAAQYFPGLLAASAGAKDGVRKKPAPDSVFAVIHQLGAEGLRAVYIGDSEVDLQTAQNAALPCISVSWGFRDRSVLEQAGAACICDTVDALYQAICNG